MLSETEFPLNLEVVTLQLVSDLDEIEYAVHRAAIHLAGPKHVEQEDKAVASQILRLRAELFEFVHRHIFYSNPSETSERIQYSGANLSQSRQTSVDERPCFQRGSWVVARVNQLCEAFLLLLSSQNHKKNTAIELRLALMFDAAIRCRGRLALVSGIRYELVRFEEGDLFDPDFMEVQSADGIFDPRISSRIPRIGSCVHGCLVALFASELETQEGKTGRHARFPEQHRGILLSKKAIVVLGKCDKKM